MAVSKQPAITPETSSAERPDEEPTARAEAKWKRFHPFRVVRKIFRRRVKREGNSSVSDSSKKSWSTSELQSVQDDNPNKCEVASPLKIGLSVSHDSIFSPENNSSIVNSEALSVPHDSSLSVRHTSMKNMFKDELFTRIRARRDSEDDGIGMQSSSCSSPTTVDVLNQGFKEKMPKSQTTCSAGSLISMESSENDEDSTGHSSGHSSRMSLLDRRSIDSEFDAEVAQPVPLNHNAALHKIAVRPKRTHGLPRRRMKQVSAANANSLPSTPEVTEDVTKGFQDFDLEATKTSKENQTISTAESTSVLTVETDISSHVSSSSHLEVSQSVLEKNYEITNKSSNENVTAVTKMVQEDSKFRTTSIFKQDISQNIEVQKAVTETVNKESNFIVNTSKFTTNPLIDSKLALEKKDNNEIESFKLVKQSIQEISKTDEPRVNDSGNISPTKSLEMSMKSDKLRKYSDIKAPEKTDKLKRTTEKNSEDTELQFENKISKDEEHMNSKTINNHIFEHSVSNSKSSEYQSTKTFDLTHEMKILSPECVNELVKRNSITENLDIESEFVLKPIKKEKRLSSDELSKELMDNKSENSIVSSVHLEEESIMSNKSLSIGSNEESRILVSNNVSFSDDLKDILVTEAHNYISLAEKTEISSVNSNDGFMSEPAETSEPNASSDEVTTSSSTVDVTSSSTSSFCDKVAEDKITVSVNSKSSKMESKIMSSKSDAPENISISNVMNAAIDNNQKVKEQPLKHVQKSHLPDINKSLPKNTNIQKRVSVEIVPFSQRMKERKYQPISFSNKESSSDKKSSNNLIERKLSDRKVTEKNKELDKSSNRHSFSGALSHENKKPDIAALKREEKSEKLQYPVQIRIHKSAPKPEIKEKIASSILTTDYRNTNKEGGTDVKFQMTSAKSAQNNLKSLKEKSANITPTKWEIKIQPASAKVSPALTNDTTSSTATSHNSFIQMSESIKVSQTSVIETKEQISHDSESSCLKNDNRKSPKDASVPSDDPEPELLRVFARRSIKQKHCDKNKDDESDKYSDVSTTEESSTIDISEENKDTTSISRNSTVIKISDTTKPHITKPDFKKKSKSFCDKEKSPRSISPLKEMNLIRRESPTRPLAETSVENVQTKHRLSNVSDTFVLASESEKNSVKNTQNELVLNATSKDDTVHKSNTISTTSPNALYSSMGIVKENQEIPGKDGHAPSWLQLAQQRRELREQRERLLLGGSPNSFMDASSKPTRSSKVWDMVNNFQKLQMT